MVSVLTMIAILNTSIILGSRLGAWTAGDWIKVLSGAGLPDMPGKTVVGGMLLMIVVFMALRRWWKIPLSMADVLVLGLPLAAVSGRIGCLMAGCCYGIPTNADWGIAYGPGTPAYLHQVATGNLLEGANASAFLFPTQLLLIGNNLLLFMVLWVLRSKIIRPGALALLGLGLVALQRFGIEFFRDAVTNQGMFGIFAGGLKITQWLSLLLALGSFTGFWLIHFNQNKQLQEHNPGSRHIRSSQLAYALGGITVGSFLIHNVMTIAETLFILASCAPAIILLSRILWREYILGKSVLVQASMLSATTILLITNPLDSIPKNTQAKEWKRWIDVGAGGIFGKYKEEKAVERDCNGNVVRKEIDEISAKYGGGEINANFQNGSDKFQIGIRGAFGQNSTLENSDPNDNNHYTSLGVRGEYSGNIVGLAIGVFNQQKTYPAKVGQNSNAKLLGLGSLRLGRLSSLFIDLRVYDEPILAMSYQPISSGGINWGFGDPSGNARIRLGVATAGSEAAIMFAGSIPFTKQLSGSLAAYFGNANLFSFGLRYQFKER